MSTGEAGAVIPGEVATGTEPVELNPGRPRTTLTVVNTGDRPVQIGSHFHFADANDALAFDRDAAAGLRLDVPAGTAVRFEPGAEREVTLVPLAGARTVPGLRLGRSSGAGSAATEPGESSGTAGGEATR